jgi:hypothetical protein
MSIAKNVEPATTFAEGPPVPAPVAETVESRQAKADAAPSKSDYAREWNTYRALTNLTVGTSTAVAAGGPVPASHPYLRDSDELGPGWVSQGAVELTGNYEAPEDLLAAHAAVKDAEEK